MLSLGIVGCGRVTRMFHVKAIDQISDLCIGAVSDVDAAAMNKVMNRSSVPKGYDAYEGLLADDEIDAITVNTPPRFHEEMVLQALDSGKHVLCEKPLSTSVEGCHRIRDKRDETGLVVLPAHNYSFTPGLYTMERLIKEGSIGELAGMRVAFENNLKQYRASTDFRTQKINGLVEDVLPHILSVVTPILGHFSEVEDVEWMRKTYDVCDNMSATLRTFSGIPVECTMSWTKLVPKFEVEVTGSNGRLSGEFGLRPYAVVLTIGKETQVFNEKGLGWYLDLLKFKHPSFQNQYMHFVDLIEGRSYPRVTITDEVNTLRAIEALSSYLE